jgi:hypothetical protein
MVIRGSLLGDVCDIFELGNITEALRKLDDDEVSDFSITEVRSDGVVQNRLVKIINESGFYTLIVRSRKPVAKRIRKWLTSEVIPQLRRTGRYIMPGAIPPEAQYQQIAGGSNYQMIAVENDLLDALWLYSIGAISRADLYRFRFSAKREPTEWELTIDPLGLMYVQHIEAVRKILAIPDADFPIKGPLLSKMVYGDSAFRGVWHQNSFHTEYEGQKEFSVGACLFLCDRWFATGHEEEDEFNRMPKVKETYAALRAEREHAESAEGLPPVYVWHKLGRAEFDELRARYNEGFHDAREVRRLLFGDQLAGVKDALPPPAERLRIMGVSYEDALAKIEDAYESVKQLTPAGIARACGLPRETMERAQQQTAARKRQTMKLADARLALNIAYNRGGAS